MLSISKKLLSLQFFKVYCKSLNQHAGFWIAVGFTTLALVLTYEINNFNICNRTESFFGAALQHTYWLPAISFSITACVLSILFIKNKNFKFISILTSFFLLFASLSGFLYWTNKSWGFVCCL